MDEILKGLNAKQVEAVKAVSGPVLVISGPGSGKTRCLTHRVAYLIASGVKPENILAVTFTNKAAGEMKQRVAKLLKGSPSRSSGRLPATPAIGTFHSICLRILRIHAEKLGYAKNFSVADTDDQLTLLKKVLADLDIDPKKYNPRAILSTISKLKTELASPAEAVAKAGAEFFPQIVAATYTEYQKQLHLMNAMDFDDLIGQTVRLYREHPKVLEQYQNLWQYILVDEYQDTSHDQYQLIRLLAAKYRNLFCIGDDAQSIYMFREADIRNILNFEKDYPDAKIIMLEQNYRSTQNILDAAQNIIDNNKNQMRKTLWTENDRGAKILVEETMSERHEGHVLISHMEELMGNGHGVEDFVVLYRTHAQSRAIEEALVKRGFPYRIVGGIKFYDRKEIKDILAYLKIIANPRDFVNLSRIVNVPPRGIGRATLELITNGERINKRMGTLPERLMEVAGERSGAKTSEALRNFAKLLEDFEKTAKEKPLSATIRHIVKKLNYEDYLRAAYTGKDDDDYETAEERIENLKELFTVAKKFDEFGPEGLMKFLEEITLLQETDRVREGKVSPLGKTAEKQGKITLMTMHASKGLEFPVVFIAGMEEGLFPHSRTMFNPVELEEERRLCYVAITRAKERLIITHAKWRNIYGSTSANLPSRFIGEIPEGLLEYQSTSSGDDWEEATIEY